MPGNDTPTLAQKKAAKELVGLIGSKHVSGRSLCCLIGSQGCGKSWLANHISGLDEFGQVRILSVNNIILDMLEKEPKFTEIFDLRATIMQAEMKRYGKSLRKAIHDIIAEQLLSDGLTILDHIELIFALGIDPVTLWYNDAVGKRRILLILTGRMSGQLCQCGQFTLTRGDQPIIELEV